MLWCSRKNPLLSAVHILVLRSGDHEETKSTIGVDRCIFKVVLSLYVRYCGYVPAGTPLVPAGMPHGFRRRKQLLKICNIWIICWYSINPHIWQINYDITYDKSQYCCLVIKWFPRLLGICSFCANWNICASCAVRFVPQLSHRGWFFPASDDAVCRG